MPARILQGKEIALKMRRELPEQLEAIRAKGVEPHLVSILVGEDPASTVYAASQKRSFAKAGIPYTFRQLQGGTSEEDLLACVRKLDGDPSVTGIILQLPLPKGIDPSRIHQAIRPEKDVEGMSPSNLGSLVLERPGLLPCTAQAVYEMIRSAEMELEGKEVVVVGHSPLVGKPISLLLVNDLATVTTCHIGTRDVGAHTREAEILIAAVGKPGLIRGSMIRPGALVIDVGISVVEAKEGARSQSVGDVAFDEALEVAGQITPVPGGVGPVTVAVLLRNTLRAAALQAG